MPAPDPITLELFRALFESAAEEMGLTLQRVAFSANIKERRDFSCALFDPAGNLLAQAAHIPVHLGSMPASVDAVIRSLPPLAPDQIAIVNDPFAGGTHLPDITLVSPIHHDGVLLGYAADRAHHADVGGSTPGSMTLSTHIDQEGFRIQPSLLTPELLDRFLAAVRTPDERRGDLDAQLAANAVGARALLRILDRHGLTALRTYSAALLDYSQSFMSQTIQNIPDGTYSFQDVLDDDGAGTTNIPIRCTLTVQGDRATVDLRDSSPQVPGCVNCPAAVTASAVYYCFCCLLPPSVPLNAGCFRNITVLTKPGTVVHAQYPAAVVAGNTETSQRIVDVLLACLAQALPHQIPAASCGTMSSLALGSQPVTSNQRPVPPPWTYYETIGGGCGAGPTWNGESAIQTHMTNTLNTPAEALELEYPLRVLRFERAPQTGGRGKQQGGDGILRQLQSLAPAQGTLLTDRRASKPYGLSRGSPADCGSNSLNHQPLPGKCQFTLLPNDILTIITPGGGGFGNPL
jgi:N-methylhydantoinase B